MDYLIVDNCDEEKMKNNVKGYFEIKNIQVGDHLMEKTDEYFYRCQKYKNIKARIGKERE